MEKSRFSILAVFLASALILSCPSAVTGFKPAAPTSVAAAALSSSSIALSWVDASSGKASFKVERSSSATGTFTLAGFPAATVTTWTDTGLSSSTAYWYRVYAVLGTLVSDYSAVVTATTEASPTGGGSQVPTVPAAPTNLAVAAAGKTSISLTWTDNADNETGYRVLRVTSLTDANPVVASGTSPLAANTTSFTETGLSAATDYYYVVVAINSVGSSDMTSLVGATTLSSSSLLAPTGVAASKGTFGTKIYLDWTAVPGAAGYKTWESWATDSPFTLLGQSTTNYAWINNSTAQTHNFFKVCAVDSSGNQTGRSAVVEGWAGSSPFDEDFEAPRLQGYWDQRLVATSTQAVATLASPGYGGTGSCLALSGGDGAKYAGYSVDSGSNLTPTSISFRVKASAVSNTAYFGAYDDSATPLRAIYAKFTSTGKIVVVNWDSVWKGNVSYAANTWYKLEFQNFNWTASPHPTYDFYVDGSLAASGVTFYYDATSFASLHLFLLDAGVQAYWDDILVQ